MPGFLGGSSASKTESHASKSETTKRKEELRVNGHPVAIDDDDDDAPKPKTTSKRAQHDDDDRGNEGKVAIGKTCKTNRECPGANGGCFVGNGDLGYCTMMCHDETDCPFPMSRWKCAKPGNAPQRICMQND